MSGKEEATTWVKVIPRSARIMLVPVESKQSIWKDEGVVVEAQQFVVSFVECPSADGFHLLRVVDVFIAAVEEDLVGEWQSMVATTIEKLIGNL